MGLLDKLLFWRKPTDHDAYVIDGCFPMEGDPASLVVGEEAAPRPSGGPRDGDDHD